MTSAEQEALWKKQINDCLIRLIDRVKLAVQTTSPTRRTALYQQWRKDHGDDTARESAKYAEAVIAGRRTIYELERMVKREDPALPTTASLF
jgi:hypothetical protein